MKYLLIVSLFLPLVSFAAIEGVALPTAPVEFVGNVDTPSTPVSDAPAKVDVATGRGCCYAPRIAWEEMPGVRNVACMFKEGCMDISDTEYGRNERKEIRRQLIERGMLHLFPMWQ